MTPKVPISRDLNPEVESVSIDSELDRIRTLPDRDDRLSAYRTLRDSLPAGGRRLRVTYRMLAELDEEGEEE